MTQYASIKNIFCVCLQIQFQSNRKQNKKIQKNENINKIFFIPFRSVLMLFFVLQKCCCCCMFSSFSLPSTFFPIQKDTKLLLFKRTPYTANRKHVVNSLYGHYL